MVTYEHIPCPLCGIDDPRLLYTIDMANVTLSSVWLEGRSEPVTEPARIVTCRRCSFGYVNPRIVMQPGQMPYSAESEHEHFVHSRPARLLMCRNLFHELPRLLGRPAESLLDIGCGDALLIDVALEQGLRCAGVEISPVLLQQARDRFGDRAAFAEDVQQLPAATYDVVTLISVLEHVYDPYAVLRAAMSRLAPGGALLVNVPNCAGLPARLRGARWDQIEPLAHLHYFTARTLAAMLNRAGMHVVGRFTMTSRMELARRDSLRFARRAAYQLEMYLGTDLGLVART